MKVPSKAELKETIRYLTKQNEKLVAEKEAEERKKWRENVDGAVSYFMRLLKERFGKSVYMFRLDHVDRAGYWFQFTLVNDMRVQTYCVRHDEAQRR